MTLDFILTYKSKRDRERQGERGPGRVLPFNKIAHHFELQRYLLLEKWMSPISEIAWNVQSGEKMDRGLMSQEVLCEFMWIYNRARPSNGKSQTLSVFHYSVFDLLSTQDTLKGEQASQGPYKQKFKTKTFPFNPKHFQRIQMMYISFSEWVIL